MSTLMANKSTKKTKATDPNAEDLTNANVTPQHEYGLLEDPDALADRLSQSEDFVKKHKNTLIGVFVVIALAIAGTFFYYSYKKNQEVEAQKAMFQAVYDFEADSLNTALKGDARYKGL